MAAPLGNRFWEARSTHGRQPIFASPEALWRSCTEYFEWVQDNPLYESKALVVKGELEIAEIPKMRAMTISALCIFLDISVKTWNEYRERHDFTPVTTRVDAIIRNQKFEGAAAEMLNANIIARDLGLADKSEITGKDGKPLIDAYSDADRVKALMALLAKGGEKSEQD